MFIWDIANNMEFPRLSYFLSLSSLSPDTHWNLPVAIPIYVFQFPRLRQKYGILTASGDLRMFEVEKNGNTTPTAGFIEEKRWDNSAVAFLGNLQRQKALNLVMRMQNNPELPAKLTLRDIFVHNDLIDIFSVSLADEMRVHLSSSCTSFAVGSWLG